MMYPYPPLMCISRCSLLCGCQALCPVVKVRYIMSHDIKELLYDSCWDDEYFCINGDCNLS